MGQKSKPLIVLPTPEGWVYIVILLFVTVGAILRSVNLLVVMAGMMSAPMLINWRIQRHMLNNIRVNRAVPRHLHAGQIVNIQWKCRNLSRRLSAWNLIVQDKITRLEKDSGEGFVSQEMELEEETRLTPRRPDETAKQYQARRSEFLARRDARKRQAKVIRKGKNSSIATVTVPEVECESTSFRSYRCLFGQRGRYQLGPATASTVFPFGLLSARKDVAENQQVMVAPKLGMLSPVWDKRLRSIALGTEAVSRRVGMNEEEFYAIRQWRSGDSQRHIHWRSTAKRNSPMVRQFDQQTDRDMALLLDLYLPNAPADLLDASQKNYEPEHYRRRCESALSFAATVLASLQQEVKGYLAIAIAGKRPAMMADRNHHEFLVRLMRELALAELGSPQNIGPLISQFASQVSQGTPIYVVSSRTRPSDLFDVDDEQTVRLRSQVHWLNVDDPQFHQLFSPERNSDMNQLEQLEERWAGDVEC